MEQVPQTLRERALVLIKLLLGVESDWQPTMRHYLWGIRIVVAATVLAFVIFLIGGWLWDILADYVKPKTATQRKDLANIFVVVAVGVVGALTAIAALGNLYISRRNLQNARETLAYQRSLEEQRGQGAAVQSYLQQISDLMTEQDIHTTYPGATVRVLARAQTLSVLEGLDASHKRAVVTFLYDTRLIASPEPGETGIIRLVGADLIEADLSEANLRSADLSGADLRGADLRGANLRGADLRGADLSAADLSAADLSAADLSEADLRGATVTKEQLGKASPLEGATLPNGQKYE